MILYKLVYMESTTTAKYSVSYIFGRILKTEWLTCCKMDPHQIHHKSSQPCTPDYLIQCYKAIPAIHNKDSWKTIKQILQVCKFPAINSPRVIDHDKAEWPTQNYCMVQATHKLIEKTQIGTSLTLLGVQRVGKSHTTKSPQNRQTSIKL